jgi:hypothetical protein
VQDERTRDISSAVRVTRAGGATGAKPMKDTTDIETYDLYLRGIHFLRQRGSGVMGSIRYFRQALARDSTYARAWSACTISPNASTDVIDAAWKALMRTYHPDGAKPNVKKAIQINQAHDILTDPQKRVAYDLQLKMSKPQVVNMGRRPGRAYGPAYGRDEEFPPAVPPISPFVGFDPFSPFVDFDPSELFDLAIQGGMKAVFEELQKRNPVMREFLKRAK